jgi:addiction module RelE/StbE family toxin
MFRVRYSGAANRDLTQIGDYIADELKNPRAALSTLNRIQDAIDKLSEFPLMGAPLSCVTGVDTDYRFLICGNYLAFYRPQEDEVLIDRILYGRRDYLTILFGNLPKDEM